MDSLAQQTGITSVSGPGVILNIVPASELIEFGYRIEPISPDLLIRLVNEIYHYNGLFVEIGGQRIVHTSAIRDINGATTVNGVPIDKSNLEIRVITNSYEDAEKLYSYLYASSFRDEFYLDNLNLVINEAQSNLTIDEYDGDLTNTYLVENSKGD